MNLEPMLDTRRVRVLEDTAPEPVYRSLHGTPDPLRELDREKPWHRPAMTMFSLGATVREVAKAFDKSEPTVSNALRQPWFQDQLVTIMEAEGKDIMTLFRAEAFNSLVTLVETRDNDKVSPAVRVSCARDILDRAHGKALQRIESSSTVTSLNPVAEVAAIERENQHLLSQTNETR